MCDSHHMFAYFALQQLQPAVLESNSSPNRHCCTQQLIITLATIAQTGWHGWVLSLDIAGTCAAQHIHPTPQSVQGSTRFSKQQKANRGRLQLVGVLTGTCLPHHRLNARVRIGCLASVVWVGGRENTKTAYTCDFTLQTAGSLSGVRL